MDDHETAPNKQPSLGQRTSCVVQRIVAAHHDLLWARLPFLVPMAAKLAKNRCGDKGSYLEIVSLVVELKTLVLDHLEREEKTLSLACENGDANLLAESVDALHREHVAIRALLDRVRAAAIRPLVSGCATERALHHDLERIDQHVRTHIIIEEEILARAIRLNDATP